MRLLLLSPNRISLLSGWFCGLAMFLCIAAPAHLLAQAAPGPMRPPADLPAPASPPFAPQAQTPVQAQPEPPRETPAPRQNIGGYWKLNRDQSDDGRKKIEQAERPVNTQPNNGPIGGNGPFGGPLGRPYPYPGGPMGGPVGGPMGGPRNNPQDYGDNETQLPAMAEFLYPATGVTFLLQGPEADLTDDAARRRVFYTDGRKLEKPTDENYREIAAHWEGNRLVSEEKSPAGGQLRRTFELSSDGRQLEETIYLDANRYRPAVTIRYVYDIDPNRQQ